MTEPRPKVDGAMKLEAAKIVATKIGDVSYAESITKQYQYPTDGYELAKLLDRYECWDTTREEMELLDEMDWLVSEALRKAEKEWLDRNDIKPPHPIGARIQHRDIVGTITGVSEHHAAKYLVKLDDQDDAASGERRYIISFEDAVAA